MSWKEAQTQKGTWFAGPEAYAIANAVLLYQTESGGWPKNRDLTKPPGETLPADAADHIDVTVATIDNGATTEPLWFLANVLAEHDDARLRAAWDRGFDYLIRAQYQNGGYPQFFPLRDGYYRRITFNDDAMLHVLDLLRAVARGEYPVAFATSRQRALAAEAVDKGIECILRCQVIVDGKKTVWCAQHDEHTFAPASARRYELVSLSGMESAGLVRFLMEEKHPSREVREAIRAAVIWFEANKLAGIRVERVTDSTAPRGFDVKVVSDPSAEPLWARFYEIGTNRPLFAGRAGVKLYSLAEVEIERRTGYRWYTDEPAKVVGKNYASWEQTHHD